MPLAVGLSLLAKAEMKLCWGCWGGTRRWGCTHTSAVKAPAGAQRASLQQVTPHTPRHPHQQHAGPHVLQGDRGSGREVYGVQGGLSRACCARWWKLNKGEEESSGPEGPRWVRVRAGGLTPSFQHQCPSRIPAAWPSAPTAVTVSPRHFRFLLDRTAWLGPTPPAPPQVGSGAGEGLGV